MSVVFRADGKPVASRLDHWHHVVEETFGPLRLRPPSGAQSPHRLVVGDVGAVRVAELKVTWTTPSARCEGARTPRLISPGGSAGLPGRPGGARADGGRAGRPGGLAGAG